MILIKVIIEKLLDFIFPRKCGICSQKTNLKYTCTNCLNILKYCRGRVYTHEDKLIKLSSINPDVDSYGIINKNNFDFFIINKNRKEIFYDTAICAHEYSGKLKLKMIAFKFYGRKSISKSFGELLSLIAKRNNIVADIIIPVPISSKRKFSRGYNQSLLIAKEVAKNLKIKLNSNILIKFKNNERQSSLNVQRRMGNVKNVYKVIKKELVANKKILLVDDIYTTGATVNECAKVLKEKGAKSIVVLTVLYSDKNKLR